MEWIELFGILITAIFIGAIFFYGFKVRGPWGSFWPFLLIIIGGIWLASAISEPVGPVYWEVAWFDFLFIGLIFAFILAATTPSRIDRQRYKEFYANPKPEEEPTDPVGPAIAVGIWFWLMMLLIVIAILVATLS
ncbi:hypothetical protein [Psychroflexus aestuariivivens]|uniref:hypothetical protein n=1 Tax=Psychroflexus aestuariivivens TaxID=1795040 RepID=UPI000FDBE0C7|nr:hypothetical protein [Psychroflexus aestuariivivens]